MPLKHCKSFFIFFLKVWHQNDKENIIKLLVELFQAPVILPSIIQFLPKLLPELLFRLLESSMKGKSEEEEANTLTIIFELIKFKNINTCQRSLFTYFEYISKRVQNYQSHGHVLLFLKVIFNWCVISGKLPFSFCSEEKLSYFIHSTDLGSRFYTYKLLALSYGIVDVDSYMQKHFEPTELIECEETTFEQHLTNLQHSQNQTDISSINFHKSFESSDFKSDFIFFFGIPLYVLDKNTIQSSSNVTTDVILTASTLKNLQSLVYGYLSNNMVVLSGEIGCGKTMIIQNLFAKHMGRTESPKLLKLQLGEQTDCKVCYFTVFYF